MSALQSATGKHLMAIRHVALLQIQGKEFQLTPLPLRTVRPFIIEDIVLSEVADEAGLDLNDQMAITKFLKGKVSLFSVFTNSECWLNRLPFTRSILSSNKPINSGMNVTRKQLKMANQNFLGCCLLSDSRYVLYLF